MAVQSAVFVVLAIGADAVSFDFPKQCLLQMACSSRDQKWAEVLACARRLPPADFRAWDFRTIYYVNRALYFNGELLDRMFTYPQTLHKPTLAIVRETATEMADSTPRQCSEVLFDLGRINESEHMAYESLEYYGGLPRVLKRLVYINVLKGEPEAARRFLHFIEPSLLYGPWARRRLRQLDADPALSGVPAVASRREVMVVRDSINDVTELEKMLQGLLEANGRNRMAFEYLMAHYLLTRQLDKLVANLHRFDDFDYPRLPKHCEEALVIYQETSGFRDLDLGRRKIDPETRRRFSEFVRLERQYREDVSTAFTLLHPDYGDSYFFCYVFGCNIVAVGQSGPPR